MPNNMPSNSPGTTMGTSTAPAKPARRGGGRGFASMDEKRQREIASMGGRAAHRSGNAHEFTPEEAREAGRKGGQAVSRDRQHMAEIGSKGGQSRGRGPSTRGTRH